VQFLDYIFELWGNDGRHLNNFGVLGFAYFLVKNRPRFFDGEELIINAMRSRNMGKRGNISTSDRSDFTKLQYLKDRWSKPGDILAIEATRRPDIVAYVINQWFWRNVPKQNRIWRPETTL
jgi:hypothetical protein